MSDWKAPGPAEGGRPHSGSEATAAPVRLRLFASAREAAGTPQAELPGRTVGEVLAAAVERFGGTFAAVLARSRVWVNGTPADPATPVAPGDEVAVLPPVSGGAA